MPCGGQGDPYTSTMPCLSRRWASRGRVAFHSFSDSLNEDARNGTLSISNKGSSLPSAETSTSPICTTPCCTPRLTSGRLSRVLLDCTLISSAPAVAALTSSANWRAFWVR
ncbi:Uncharacterised protein [Bordetella pertussis]|nr:Uncharacterised protein [Bordetella pertussis]CPN68867.1 Uncharacterised protein [Bordetella pertussis]